MNLSLRDIFQIGKNAVQLFPANPESPCLQLQAFRVLTRGGGATEIATENLGAVPTDKDNPFFWSRKWHNNKYSPNALEFDFPILTMFETFGETSTTPFVKPFGRTYTIELAVFDKYQDDCVDGKYTGCKARTINDIYLDTGTLLDSALRYIGGTVGATTADGVERIYYRPWLESAYALGGVGAYNITWMLGNQLFAQNKAVRFSRVDRFAANNIFGTKCQIVFTTNNCETIDYDLELPDFGTLAFEAGCKNC
jgi:hypothetical protein